MDSKTTFLLSILIQYYQMKKKNSESNKNFLDIWSYYKQHLNTYNHLFAYHNYHIFHVLYMHSTS